MKNLDRMGVPYELAAIEKLVADAKRRRELEGDTDDGPSLWYNDKVGPGALNPNRRAQPLVHDTC